LGLVWMWSHALVFFIGAGFALLSLLAAQLIPYDPGPGRETVASDQSQGPVGASS